MILKLLLITCMVNVIFMNLSSCDSDMLMEFNSLDFRVLVISIMVLRVIHVIIHNRCFSVKCNDGGLQSLVFNFKFGDFHVGIVKLFLHEKFLVIELLEDNLGWVSGSLSWALGG